MEKIIDIEKIQKSNNLEELIDTIVKLYTEVCDLRAENERLKELLKKDSSNSSQPPSLDKKRRKKKSRKKDIAKKPKGGQIGHQGVRREIFPEEEVSEFIVCPIEEEICEKCKEGIVVEKIERHQVTDIPSEIKPIITEYQIEHGGCKCCNKKYKGELPQGVFGNFGINIITLASILRTEYRFSIRKVQKYIKKQFGIDISVGTLSNKEALVKEALSPLYQKLKESLKKSPVKHVDETGFGHNGERKGQAWVVSSEEGTLFHINKSRGSKVAKDLLGENVVGTVVSDRYAGYHWIDGNQRQVCLAHLMRDFTAISQREGKAGKIGKELLKNLQNVFKVFYKWQEKHKPEELEALQEMLSPNITLMKNLLNNATICGDITTERTCKKILDLENSIWTFAYVKNVPLTNNRAERALRPLVIHRKLSFGSKSIRGSEFIERVFSILLTAQQKGLDFFSQIKHSLSDLLSQPLLNQTKIVSKSS